MSTTRLPRGQWKRGSLHRFFGLFLIGDGCWEWQGAASSMKELLQLGLISCLSVSGFSLQLPIAILDPTTSSTPLIERARRHRSGGAEVTRCIHNAGLL
jgi:hypothetical protein